MVNSRDFFLMDVSSLPFDLFRGGNASGFQFHEARALKDCVTYLKDGVLHVHANLTGFSSFDHITRRMRLGGRNVWKIKKGVALPVGLKMVKDMREGHEGHYMLVPNEDMPLMTYIGLLQQIERDPAKCTKLSPEEIKNGN